MKPAVLSLFDLTGNMVQPWVEAGYEAWIVDSQHKPGINDAGGGIVKVGADIRFGWMPPRDLIDRIEFVSAFPPCDHLSVSGARWFRGKGLRKLALSVDLFATAADLCEWIGQPYLIENPVSTISTYWRKPDATFHPHQFTGLEPCAATPSNEATDQRQGKAAVSGLMRTVRLTVGFCVGGGNVRHG